MKKLVVGVDVGGTNTIVGIVDGEGKIYAEEAFSTTDYPGAPSFEKYVEALHVAIDKAAKEIDSDQQITGIGVGAPNANYHNGTIENAANLPWKGTLDFTGELKKHYPNLKIKLTNDAKAAALGEKVFGGGKLMNDFLVITLGTGLGSGFITNGEVIYGHDSFAGEFGHSTVVYGGRQCGCGRKGCLETYVSATGIVRTMIELMAEKNTPSDLRKLPVKEVTSKKICEAALAGDELAKDAFERTGMFLGRAIANVATVTSPKAVFLFGGLANAGELIFEPAKRHMEENILSHYAGKIEILPSEIKGNVAILGAAALVW